jgi:hypothetical protein
MTPVGAGERVPFTSGSQRDHPQDVS